MLTALFRSRGARSGPPAPAFRTPAAPTPDPAFAARGMLGRLRDALVDAARQPQPRSDLWGEPPVFFLSAARQAEYEASRPRPAPPASNSLTVLIERVLPTLIGSVEVRQAARAVPGLRAAASRLAGELAPAKDLADVLVVPDDETVLVLHPAARAGYRLFVRGVVDLAQFHLLMIDSLTGERSEGLLPGRPLPSRFRAACQEVDPVIPAGIPMLAEGRYQLFQPTAVLPDGTVPSGFRGCEHWLWGGMSLATVRRVDGERVVVLGEPAYKMTWDVERRFPGMAAESQLIQILSPFQVAERLGRLAGRAVPVRPLREPAERLSRAA